MGKRHPLYLSNSGGDPTPRGGCVALARLSTPRGRRQRPWAPNRSMENNLQVWLAGTEFGASEALKINLEGST